MSSRNSEDYGKRYLARAEELRAIARTIKDQFARDMLLETANEYQRMAAALPWSRNRKPVSFDIIHIIRLKDGPKLAEILGFL